MSDKKKIVNINFRRIKVKNKEITKLRDRFSRSKYSVVQYSRILGVNHSVVSCVLDGVYSGKHNKKGATRRVMLELKKDGIWIGPLPWEK